MEFDIGKTALKTIVSFFHSMENTMSDSSWKIGGTLFRKPIGEILLVQPQRIGSKTYLETSMLRNVDVKKLFIQLAHVVGV